MNRPDSNSPEWFRARRDPQYDMVYGDRLFYFEPYDDNGWLREDDRRWYRLNCSYWFGDWIEENGIKDEQWEAYGGAHRAIYMVREDLLMFIKLKFL